MSTPPSSPERPDGLAVWRPSPAEAEMLHRSLDALDGALAFGAGTRARLHQLEERLVAMQTLAEDASNAESSVEDREVACAKIEIFAQQFDVFARRPVHESVPVLEGGHFRFLDAGLEPPLEVEVPNLRARGEGSLGLFEHVDRMVARIGPGGCALAGFAVPAREPNAPEDGPRGVLPEGEYTLEVTYLALDASVATVRLLDREGRVFANRRDVNLSAEGDAEEVDLGIGVALILKRVARNQEIEIEHQTLQNLVWCHDVGERLESMEGWFHETVQARDFELYALYLEQPLGIIRRVLAEIETFEARVDTEVDRLLERFGPPDGDLQEEFKPGASTWSLFETTRLPAGPSPSAGGVERFYLSHLQATAGAPDLVLRSIEQALRELSEGNSDSFARLLHRVRQALRFERGHGPQAAWITRALITAARCARGGEEEDARLAVLALQQASDAARPGSHRAA